MGKAYDRSLFIFRRDLRLDDNTGLNRALQRSKEVIPAFIFDPRQVEVNEYKSLNALQFMIESLDDLEIQLSASKGKLYYFHGVPHEILERLVEEHGIDALFTNRDYTPFSIQRDNKLEEVCDQQEIDFFKYSDYVLTNPESIYTKSGTRYKVFTYFFKTISKKEVTLPQPAELNNFFTDPINIERSDIKDQIRPKNNSNIYLHGGRTNALALLDQLNEFQDYEDTRNFPHLDGTTKLSPHNKFGTVSIREVYHHIQQLFGNSHPLIRQLYWRDFYYYIATHYPHVFGSNFYRKYNSIEWENDEEKFERWCNGSTGFPIIDAGMRQLNTTGYMHNRVRMIVASFLTKDLHIDWRWGEKYFAQMLIDYDPAVNNGNWQWAASTGADAQPYFRIFNPWSQQKKFDKECEFIKKWVPELKDLSPAKIHKLANNTIPEHIEYPPPIIDHKQESKMAKEMYKRI
jgi:deoxyribodipyrimidine photo-lyase